MRSPAQRQPDAPTGEWTLWLVVAVIGVHIIEEHALGFNAWAARALNAPVTPEDFHLTNAGVILYCVACAVIGWRAPAIALSSAALVLLNSLGFHAATSVVVGSYSPGTGTSLLLFVPAGLLAYRAAANDHVLTRRACGVSFSVALLWHVFLGSVYSIKYFWPLYP